MRNAVKIARADGVPIALGTDAGVGPHGTNGHEFTLMVEWGGMTPMQSIVAGTIERAPSCSAGTSTWARSRRASWPTSWRCRAIRSRTFTLMETPIFVMKGGAIYKTPAVALHP